jgi:hypothetical protein
MGRNRILLLFVVDVNYCPLARIGQDSGIRTHIRAKGSLIPPLPTIGLSSFWLQRSAPSVPFSTESVLDQGSEYRLSLDMDSGCPPSLNQDKRRIRSPMVEVLNLQMSVSGQMTNWNRGTFHFRGQRLPKI